MRFSINSLRTGILAYLAILILAAMLLINIAMVKFAERDLIKAKLQMGRLLLQILEKKILIVRSSSKTLIDFKTYPNFKKDIAEMLSSAGFSEAFIINRKGQRSFCTKSWEYLEQGSLVYAREVIVSRKEAIKFTGRTWGVIWLGYEKVFLSVPLLYGGRLMGVLTILSDLNPIYQQLRSSEKLILSYILLNTIILVLAGMHLISRSVIKPINKLLLITADFKDDNQYHFLPNTFPNELGQLSHSMNLMLKRLAENKHELKEHINSLEKTNIELKKAQNEVIRSEKLASLGRLATGVAHEIGNPIGIILGYLELLDDNKLNNAESRDTLRRIESEVLRIHQIIRQLLDFSRPEKLKKTGFDVHRIISETVEMLRSQPMMRQIEIQLQLEAQNSTILSDPNQLKQVFVNITLNAIDAMLEDPDLSDNKMCELTIKTCNQGDNIIIRFIDTGMGIPAENLLYVFDPFFTTKEPGKGTGLGLSVCQRIIDGMGGNIRAADSVNGADIILEIPFL